MVEHLIMRFYLGCVWCVAPAASLPTTEVRAAPKTLWGEVLWRSRMGEEELFFL
jgi:hypothetical protein